MWCWKTQVIVSNSKHATCHFPFSVLSNRSVLLLNEKPRGRFSDADFFLHYIFLLCGKIWPTSLTPVKTTRTKKSVESCVMQKNSASEYPGMTFSLHYTPGFLGWLENSDWIIWWWYILRNEPLDEDIIYGGVEVCDRQKILQARILTHAHIFHKKWPSTNRPKRWVYSWV